MSISREMRFIHEIETALISAVEGMGDEKPVHMPHAACYYAIEQYKAALALYEEAHDALHAEGDPGPMECADLMKRHVTNTMALTLIVGAEFGRRGYSLTDCTCGELKATNLEEMFNGAWRHPSRAGEADTDSGEIEG
jgi:hypothetical protein